MWLHRQGFWEGPFGLWQAADKAALAGAFWRVTGGVTRGVRDWRHGLSLSETEKPETGDRRQKTGGQSCMSTRICWVGGMGSLSSPEQKSRPKAAFFFFYPISSGYQIERRNRPNIFEGIRV